MKCYGKALTLVQVRSIGTRIRLLRANALIIVVLQHLRTVPDMLPIDTPRVGPHTGADHLLGVL